MVASKEKNTHQIGLHLCQHSKSTKAATTINLLGLLKQQFYLKRQKIYEAFEFYAWNTFSLFNKIHRTIDQKQIIDRILNSCITEIASQLLQLKCKTVEDLVCDARIIIININKIRSRQRLPFLGHGEQIH